MIEILTHLQLVLFAAINAVLRSTLNIMLYSLLFRTFNKWFGFPIIVSFFCSMYFISEIVSYIKRLWLKNRINNKSRDEIIVLNELSWESPQTRLVKINNLKFYLKFYRK
jgi:hypothetical protein